MQCMARVKWIMCALTEESVEEEIPLSLIHAPSEWVMRLQVHGVYS